MYIIVAFMINFTSIDFAQIFFQFIPVKIFKVLDLHGGEGFKNFPE